MTVAVVLHGLEAVRASPGTELGPTGWVEVAADRLAAWEQACPGSDVGWLLLSLTNLFMPEMVEVVGVSAGLNVGTGRIRFADVGTVRAGTSVRARGRITAAEQVRGGVQTTIDITVEDDRGRPLLRVESLSRWLH